MRNVSGGHFDIADLPVRKCRWHKLVLSRGCQTVIELPRAAAADRGPNRWLQDLRSVLAPSLLKSATPRPSQHNLLYRDASHSWSHEAPSPWPCCHGGC